MSQPMIYRIKVTLTGSAPPIWRRIEVEANTTLEELHVILQIAMGWTDSHLHAFRVGGVVYSGRDSEYFDGLRDEAGVRLNGVAAEGETVYYEYDFGDGWDHELKIEKVRPLDPGDRYPRCLAGERACPPEDCGGIPSYERLLRILADLDDEEHEETRDWLGNDFDPDAFDLQEVNAMLEEAEADELIGFSPVELLTDAELATLDEPALIDILRRSGDRAPRNLIDACAARGDAMVQALASVLSAPAFWSDDIDDGNWWLRQHAAMILGLIDTENAGRELVALMRRLDREDDDNTQDWLAGNWPALYTNKPVSLAPELRRLAEDRAHDWYIRINAAETYLALAQRGGESVFETALDWAAAMAADEQEEWTLRLNLGGELLDSPRPRHRLLLEMLASRQTGLGKHFEARDIEDSYARGVDAPEWERFTNPWAFHDPDVIRARQERWAEEEARRPENEQQGEVLPFQDWAAPYVRETPKIGRNDPCPCGSGKKYKKCCLH